MKNELRPWDHYRSYECIARSKPGFLGLDDSIAKLSKRLERAEWNSPQLYEGFRQGKVFAAD